MLAADDLYEMDIGLVGEQRVRFDCRAQWGNIHSAQVIDEVGAMGITHAARRRASSEWQGECVEFPSQGHIRPAQQRLAHGYCNVTAAGPLTGQQAALRANCLLYTSDAADE